MEIADRELVYHQRTIRASEVCRDFDKSIYRGPGWSRLLCNEEHSLAYCPIPKVSSSFWTLNMVKLDHELSVDAFWNVTKMGPSLPQIKRAHVVAAKKLDLSPTQAKNISSLLSFVVVRHPFERLASAYFQKIIDMGHRVAQLSLSFFSKISSKISLSIQEWNKQRKTIISKYREHNESEMKQASAMPGHEELSAEYPR